MKRSVKRTSLPTTATVVCLIALGTGAYWALHQTQDQVNDEAPQIYALQAVPTPVSAQYSNGAQHASSSQGIAERRKDPCAPTGGISPFSWAPAIPHPEAARISAIISTNCDQQTTPEPLSSMLESELSANKENEGLVSWNNLTPTSSNTSIGGTNTNGHRSPDGVLINIDQPVKDLVSTIQASLNSGQIVVLDTSGGDANQQKIHDLTLEHGSFGVFADAVMLYKSAAGAEVSVLPFDTAEKKELASLMAVVGRRRAEGTANQ